MRTYEIIVNWIILADIPINFLTSMKKSHFRPQEVALNYVKGFFVIDLLCCVPSLVMMEVVSAYYLKFFRFLRIHRIYDVVDIFLDKAFISRGASKFKVRQLEYF